MATTGPRAAFLSLPLEMRELIYALIISEGPNINTYDQNPPFHSMLLVNRQIHEEYAKIYYGSHIFHLHIPRRNANDSKTPDPSGLGEWRSRSPLMLGCVREVMVHFDIFFHTIPPDAPRPATPNVSWLAAGLALAPNIEILHIVLFCTRSAIKSIPVPFLSKVNPLGEDTVKKRVLEVIPLIKDCCQASVLPNLLRVVLHVDARHGNETTKTFMENMEGWRWVRSFSRSLVSCDNTEYNGWGTHFSEHMFRITS